MSVQCHSVSESTDKLNNPSANEVGLWPIYGMCESGTVICSILLGWVVPSNH